MIICCGAKGENFKRAVEEEVGHAGRGRSIIIAIINEVC